MLWITALPAILAGVALLMVPGLVVGALIGLRRLWLWALAPAISITLLTAGSIVLPWIGLSWSPLTALAGAVVFGAIVVALFRFVLRSRFDIPAPESGSSWPTVVAWAFGSIVLVSLGAAGIGAPENFSQTFDNVFHLNAIAFIGDTGNASPFETARLSFPDGGQGFYPNGWHSLAELVGQLSGASVPLAINALNLATLMTIWPLGVLLLSRQLAGSSRVATLAAGVLLAAFPMLPLNLLYYGVLYPFFFGLALAPVTLAIVLNLIEVARERRIAGTASQIVLLAGVTFAISIAHPGAMMAVLALSVPAAVVATFAGWRSFTARRRIWHLVGFAAFLVAGLAMLLGLRQTDWWGPRMSHAEAAWQAVSLTLGDYGLPLLTAALLVIGIVFALRRRDRSSLAALGIWLIAAILFFVTAAASNTLLRFPTWVWYGDTPRLAAVYVIAVIPLAVLGLRWVVEALDRRVSRSWILETAALVVLAAVALGSAGYGSLINNMRGSYTAVPDAPLLSPDELALLERLPSEVGEDEMIAGNPWTGTSLAFAFSDRRVVLPHILMGTIGSDRELVMAHLDDAASDPAVCEAADRLGVRYVLDFGTREVHGDQHDYAGIDQLDRADTFELVDEAGDARLYRLIACD